MARRKLTVEEKERLVEARLRARKDRQKALSLLHENTQVVNPRFWEFVDSPTFEKLEHAMHQARIVRMQERIKSLEGQLAQERRELESLMNGEAA